MLLEDFDNLGVASVAHLCENSKFKVFFTLFDATHFFKVIRNYWYTAETQILEFENPENKGNVILRNGMISNISMKKKHKVVLSKKPS